MSTTENTTVNKTVAIEDLVQGAEVTVFDNVGMSTFHRCDRCGAQAQVEVEVFDTGSEHKQFKLWALRPGDTAKRVLVFCAHHYGQHEEALKRQAVRIMDHRPFLAATEKRMKGQV